MTPTEEALLADIRASNAAIPEEDATWLASSLYTRGWAQNYAEAIKDSEELDRYPVGTLIRALGSEGAPAQAWQRTTRTSYCWSAVGYPGRETSEAVIDACPNGVLVAYEPR